MLIKPSLRPSRPLFSSGPCVKRPGWSLAALDRVLAGRSHRSKPGRDKLAAVIDGSREILGIPADWRVGILAASDTGAVEAALWSLLGSRPVDVLAFESFSADWAKDVTQQLRLDARVIAAPYGLLPDLTAVDWDRDVVMAWNGTTSGVRIPDGAIPANHGGLVICDATSAAFAMDLPYDRLDVVTWSWQKALGGEAGHGMLALSPRAALRLTQNSPIWPMPKIFRLASQGKIGEALFRGETINTPSMLAVEDQLDALAWARSIGGLPALISRVEDNFTAIAQWVEKSGWVEFLARDRRYRSTTSVCLRFSDPWVNAQPVETQARLAATMAGTLEAEGAAFDIASYRDAPPGLRVWCGPTVEATDVYALLPWLDWAFAASVRQLQNAA